MANQTETTGNQPSGFDIAVTALASAETPPILDTDTHTLLSNVQDPYVDLDALVTMIEQQPALCARLLGIANSALYAPDPPVVTISAAIIRVLGLDLTRGIVMGYIIRKTLPADACLGFDNQRFWRSSIKLARLARELAAVHDSGPDAEGVSTTYLSGLLHRVGLLVAAAISSDELSVVLSQEDAIRLRERMLHQLGYHHLDATNAIAELWGVPKSISVNTEENSPVGEAGWYVERAKQLIEADESGETALWESCSAAIAHALGTDIEQLHSRYALAERESDSLASAF